MLTECVGSTDVKFPVRLEGLASKHHNFSSYEPELFPGLIYRMMKPKIVLLIFVSGKIVLTGAKVREEIYQAFEMIYPVLSGRPSSIIRSTKLCANGSQISASLDSSDRAASAHGWSVTRVRVTYQTPCTTKISLNTGKGIRCQFPC